MTLIEGSELQPIQQSEVRIENMDITVVHVNLTDALVAGRPAMGLWRPVNSRDS
jgi:hypothetical protein